MTPRETSREAHSPEGLSNIGALASGTSRKGASIVACLPSTMERVGTALATDPKRGLGSIRRADLGGFDEGLSVSMLGHVQRTSVRGGASGPNASRPTLSSA